MVRRDLRNVPKLTRTSPSSSNTVQPYYTASKQEKAGASCYRGDFMINSTLSPFLLSFVVILVMKITCVCSRSNGHCGRCNYYTNLRRLFNEIFHLDLPFTHWVYTSYVYHYLKPDFSIFDRILRADIRIPDSDSCHKDGIPTKRCAHEQPEPIVVDGQVINLNEKSCMVHDKYAHLYIYENAVKICVDLFSWNRALGTGMVYDYRPDKHATPPRFEDFEDSEGELDNEAYEEAENTFLLSTKRTKEDFKLKYRKLTSNCWAYDTKPVEVCTQTDSSHTPEDASNVCVTAEVLADNTTHKVVDACVTQDGNSVETQKDDVGTSLRTSENAIPWKELPFQPRYKKSPAYKKRQRLSIKRKLHILQDKVDSLTLMVTTIHSVLVKTY